MGLQALSSFMIYALINAFTPGPGNLLAFNTMTNVGWRKGRRLFFGIFVGYFFVQAVCAVFVFSLDHFIHPVMDILKYVGCAYMIWLSYRILVSKPGESALKRGSSFFIGFMLQVVNVKIYLFGITALTSFVATYYSSFWAFLLFEMIIATIGTVATFVWIFFGKVFQKTYIRFYRTINALLAFLLLFSVFGFFK